MKWENLKINKCPACNKDLMKGLKVIDEMMIHACGFKISEQRYKVIVSDMVGKKLNFKD